MSHYIIELVLWTLAAYVIGCVIGYVSRRLFGTSAEPQPAPQAAPAEAVKAQRPKGKKPL